MGARMKLGVMAMGALLFAACGAGEANPDAVRGTVEGRSFEGKSAAFGSLGLALAMVSIPDTDGLCQFAEAGTPPPGDMQWLSVFFCMAGGDPTGEYQMVPGKPQEPCDGKIAWASFVRYTGGVPSFVASDGGTASVSAYSAQELTGTVSAGFGGQSLAGQFTAGYCAALNQPSSPTGH